MLRFTFVPVVVGGLLVAAPVPPEPSAKVLVAGLSDPSAKVRNESAAALKGRADALPWLRRAARVTDKDTARRAADLLAPHEKKRQEASRRVLDACIREGQIDLFMEWYHFWQPEKQDELWEVGPKVTKAGLDLHAKRYPPDQADLPSQQIAALAASDKHRFYDSPDGFDQRNADRGVWHVRADRVTADGSCITFASVAGPIRHSLANMGRFLALGPVQAGQIRYSFLGCEGDIGNGTTEQGRPRGVSLAVSVVVCRGNFYGREIGHAVILVDGDIDLTSASRVGDSLIRASGEIRLPKNVKPVNCTIEAHAKNATAPYKFFELADVGLSLADDEEGLVVREVKADTPFGNCGIAKGDLIRAIDDVLAGNSEEFRKKVRRALVRQGDCLVTVLRGDKTIDIPVFFPTPK